MILSRQMMKSDLQITLVTSIVILGATAARAAERPLVIENTTIFDSSSKKMIGGQTLVVKEGRFAAVGPAGGKDEYPAAAEIIDGRDKFVIPGLIDAHVHLVHRIDYAHVTGDEIIPLFLAAGVTSVRSTGNEIDRPDCCCTFCRVASRHLPACLPRQRAHRRKPADPQRHRYSRHRSGQSP